MASPPAQLTQNQWDEVVSNSGTIDYEKLGGDGGKQQVIVIQHRVILLTM